MLHFPDAEELPQAFFDDLQQANMFRIFIHAHKRPSITKLVEFLFAHPGLQGLSMAINMIPYKLPPYRKSTGDGEEFGALKDLRVALQPLSNLQVTKWHRLYPYFANRHRVAERSELRERAQGFHDFLGQLEGQIGLTRCGEEGHACCCGLCMVRRADYAIKAV